MSPSSGTGEMTPIGTGGGVGLSLAQPMPYTLLSLARYAKIMGINPAHFWGASAPNVDPQVMPVSAACSAVWFKYDWQDSDRVGRLSIVDEILNAEQDIASAIGYWPAPSWISEEQVRYERPYRREFFGFGADVRGQFKGVDARWGRVVAPGRRAVSLVGTATTGAGSLAYSDQDTDGLYETAVITLPTTLTDANEIKVYFYGTDGDPDWEIREPRSKVITGGNVVIVFDAWLLIDPDLYEILPTSDGNSLIDIGVTTNFVTSVDVYQEYIDESLASCEFYWEPSYTGCLETDEACDPVTQDGCLRIRNAKAGIFSPVPATYDATDGVWELGCQWSGNREPDYLNIWYYAGDVDNKYKRGLSLNPLSDFWAQTIAWLATARLSRPVCACGNLESLTEWLRTDLSKNTRDLSFFNPQGILDNPFGTRAGEVAAWRRIAKLVQKRTAVALA